MNAQEQGRDNSNDQVKTLVDDMVIAQLKRMEADGEDISAALLSALTARYGKPDVAYEQMRDLQEQLKLVGGHEQ